MKTTKSLIGIISIFILCLTFIFAAAGCKSTEPTQASYWYGKYEKWETKTSLDIYKSSKAGRDHLEELNTIDDIMNYHKKNKEQEGMVHRSYSYALDIDPHGVKSFYDGEEYYDAFDWDSETYAMVEPFFHAIPASIKVSAKGLNYGNTQYEQFVFARHSPTTSVFRFIYYYNDDLEDLLYADTDTVSYDGTADGEKVRCLHVLKIFEKEDDEYVWHVYI